LGSNKLWGVYASDGNVYAATDGGLSIASAPNPVPGPPAGAWFRRSARLLPPPPQPQQAPAPWCHQQARLVPPAISAHTRRLAVVFELLALLALVSGAFPLAIASPIWWLRLGDSLVNLAPMVLLAVILLRFASFTLKPDADQDRRALSRQTVQLAGRWGLVFALLVPLQLISFGWLWFDSGNQLSQELSKNSAALTALRNRLNAAVSEAELRLQASTIPGLLPPPVPGSIAQQKTQLTEALDLSRSRLAANLSRQRTSAVVNYLPGSLRVLLGAMIIAAFLFTIRRHFQ
jgi:hypothetical protein